ncbi:hypothetical protein SH668x_000491 [Planctomicrobium sp. SH668]|uniref:hypothetical protein n=1 Tax=Planctomicrobium sp. SH668 TaxID=3448126 RepID=UPI003F5BA603
MNDRIRQYYFDVNSSLSDFMTLVMTAIAAGVLALVFLVLIAITLSKSYSEETKKELFLGWRKWVLLAFVAIVPIYLGRAALVLATFLIGLFGFYEFAKATGLIRERVISLAVALGAAITAYCVIDNRMDWFLLSAPISMILIMVSTIPQDRPEGYPLRISLSIAGYACFGFSLLHLAYLSNALAYRQLTLFPLLLTGMNHFFTVCGDRLIAGREFLPNTLPRRTYAGVMFSFVFTPLATIGIGRYAFKPSMLDQMETLIPMGFGISFLALLGHIVLGSIRSGAASTSTPASTKLQYFQQLDSFVFVVPAYFYYISYYLGQIGANHPYRILTGNF